MRHVICAAKLLITSLLLLAGSLAILAIALLTGFQLKRFYRERLNAGLSWLILRIWGVRVVVHDRPPEPKEPTIFISNHSSTLDMFVFPVIALPNTRFFMSGWLRRLLPIGIIGYASGVIWTARQWFPERRVAIFQRAEAMLRRTGDSVYLSPEGTRVATGGIGHFNKGTFHLATNLRWPILPFFISIPASMDPGTGVCTNGGTIHVHFLPAIDTSAWRLEDLLDNKEMVRNRYVDWHRQFHGS